MLEHGRVRPNLSIAPLFPDESYAAYAVSKIGVSRLTELQQQTIGSDPSKPGILINSVSLPIRAKPTE